MVVLFLLLSLSAGQELSTDSSFGGLSFNAGDCDNECSRLCQKFAWAIPVGPCLLTCGCVAIDGDSSVDDLAAGAGEGLIDSAKDAADGLVNDVLGPDSGIDSGSLIDDAVDAAGDLADAFGFNLQNEKSVQGPLTAPWLPEFDEYDIMLQADLSSPILSDAGSCTDECKALCAKFAWALGETDCLKSCGCVSVDDVLDAANDAVNEAGGIIDSALDAAGDIADAFGFNLQNEKSTKGPLTAPWLPEFDEYDIMLQEDSSSPITSEAGSCTAECLALCEKFAWALGEGDCLQSCGCSLLDNSPLDDLLDSVDVDGSGEELIDSLVDAASDILSDALSDVDASPDLDGLTQLNQMCFCGLIKYGMDNLECMFECGQFNIDNIPPRQDENFVASENQQRQHRQEMEIRRWREVFAPKVDANEVINTIERVKSQIENNDVPDLQDIGPEPKECQTDCVNACILFSCNAGMGVCLNNCGCNDFTGGNAIVTIDWHLPEEDTEAWDILVNGTCLLNCGMQCMEPIEGSRVGCLDSCGCAGWEKEENGNPLLPTANGARQQWQDLCPYVDAEISAVQKECDGTCAQKCLNNDKPKQIVRCLNRCGCHSGKNLKDQTKPHDVDPVCARKCANKSGRKNFNNCLNECTNAKKDNKPAPVKATTCDSVCSKTCLDKKGRAVHACLRKCGCEVERKVLNAVQTVGDQSCHDWMCMRNCSLKVTEEMSHSEWVACVNANCECNLEDFAGISASQDNSVALDDQACAYKCEFQGLNPADFAACLQLQCGVVIAVPIEEPVPVDIIFDPYVFSDSTTGGEATPDIFSEVTAGLADLGDFHPGIVDEFDWTKVFDQFGDSMFKEIIAGGPDRLAQRAEEYKMILENAPQIVQGTLDEIAQSAPAMGQAVAQMAPGVANGLAEALPAIGEQIAEQAPSVAEQIGEAADHLADQIPDIFEGIGQLLGNPYISTERTISFDEERDGCIMECQFACLVYGNGDARYCTEVCGCQLDEEEPIFIDGVPYPFIDGVPTPPEYDPGFISGVPTPTFDDGFISGVPTPPTADPGFISGVPTPTFDDGFISGVPAPTTDDGFISGVPTPPTADPGFISGVPAPTADDGFISGVPAPTVDDGFISGVPTPTADDGFISGVPAPTEKRQFTVSEEETARLFELFGIWLENRLDRTLEEMFGILDRDLNGSHDVKEVFQTILVLAGSCSNEEAQTKLDEADSDKDGKISLEEWIAAMIEEHQPTPPTTDSGFISGVPAPTNDDGFISGVPAPKADDGFISGVPTPPTADPGFISGVPAPTTDDGFISGVPTPPAADPGFISGVPTPTADDGFISGVPAPTEKRQFPVSEDEATRLFELYGIWMETRPDRALEEMFGILDRDLNGSHDAMEVFQTILVLAGSCSNEEAQTMLDDSDSNKDGKISLEEWCAGMVEGHQPTPPATEPDFISGVPAPTADDGFISGVPAPKADDGFISGVPTPPTADPGFISGVPAPTTDDGFISGVPAPSTGGTTPTADGFISGVPAPSIGGTTPTADGFISGVPAPSTAETAPAEEFNWEALLGDITNDVAVEFDWSDLSGKISSELSTNLLAETSVDSITPCKDTCTALCANSKATDCVATCDSTFCTNQVAPSNWTGLYVGFGICLLASLVIVIGYTLLKGRKEHVDVHSYQRL